jgi:hypothetical protein
MKTPFLAPGTTLVSWGLSTDTKGEKLEFSGFSKGTKGRKLIIFQIFIILHNISYRD